MSGGAYAMTRRAGQPRLGSEEWRAEGGRDGGQAEPRTLPRQGARVRSPLPRASNTVTVVQRLQLALALFLAHSLHAIPLCHLHLVAIRRRCVQLSRTKTRTSTSHPDIFFALNSLPMPSLLRSRRPAGYPKIH